MQKPELNKPSEASMSPSERRKDARKGIIQSIRTTNQDPIRLPHSLRALGHLIKIDRQISKLLII